MLQQQVGHNKTSLSQKKAPIYFFYYLCNVNFTNVYANAKIYVDGKLRTNTINNNNVLTQTGTGTPMASADNVPALNEAEMLENINYSFVANDNQITFSIEEQPADVEGRTVTFTARTILLSLLSSS